jgi:hypothetical protein
MSSTARAAFRTWFRACRAVNRATPPAPYAAHTHDGLGLVFRAGSLCPEMNGLHRADRGVSAYVLGLVTLDEARGAAKQYRRLAIETARSYRIHGARRDCPIPA